MDSDARILLTGNGSPQNKMPAAPGTLYVDVTSGTFWHKNAGTGNTGWISVPLCFGTLSPSASGIASLFSNAGAPSNGTSGTGAGIAGPGSLCVDTTNFNLYINAGTLASPTWKLVTRAS
jgi:hypothetical protein